MPQIFFNFDFFIIIIFNNTNGKQRFLHYFILFLLPFPTTVWYILDETHDGRASILLYCRRQIPWGKPDTVSSHRIQSWFRIN